MTTATRLRREVRRVKVAGSQPRAAMPAKGDIDTTTYSGRVAARLRALREERGWTVADLTERINARLGNRLANSTVHGWDNGSRKIDPDFYPMLALVFKLPLRKFLPSK